MNINVLRMEEFYEGRFFKSDGSNTGYPGGGL